MSRSSTLQYTRDQLLDLRAGRWLLDDDVIARVRSLVRRRGCRAGRQAKLKPIQPRVAFNVNCPNDACNQISTIVGNKANRRPERSRDNSTVVRPSSAPDTQHRRPTRSQATENRSTTVRCRVLVDVKAQCATTTPHPIIYKPPTLYVFNVATITKAHAIEHLAVDLLGYNVDIAVIVETHLKKKHTDHSFSIDGYSFFRRDRAGRKGGGVAVYVRSHLSAEVWTCTGDTSTFELLWVRVQIDGHEVFVGALYHPPKPIYHPAALLDYMKLPLMN